MPSSKICCKLSTVCHILYCHFVLFSSAGLPCFPTLLYSFFFFFYIQRSYLLLVNWFKMIIIASQKYLHAYSLFSVSYSWIFFGGGDVKSFVKWRIQIMNWWTGFVCVDHILFFPTLFRKLKVVDTWQVNWLIWFASVFW